jgi:hypothetical protein
MKLDVVAHTYNLSTQEAESGGSQVAGHTGLHGQDPIRKQRKIK